MDDRLTEKGLATVVKRTEKVEGFDPEKYLKLESASLEVWIAEFLKRNDEFKEVCRRHYDPDKENSPVGPLQYSDLQVYNAHESMQKLGRKLRVRIPRPVKGVRIVCPKNRKELDRLGHTLEAADENDPAFLFKYRHLYQLYDPALRPIKNETSRITKLGDPIIGSDALGYLRGKRASHDRYAKNDILLLAIDLHGDLEIIKKEIGSFLKIHKVQKVKRVRDDKWPYYLMVYDLRHMKPDGKKLTFKVIMEIVNRQGHQYSGMNTENDCSRYYDRCDKLINGGYRRYL